MAVATLSVFVVPMTEEMGWSRGLFSGAVSLGGLCAVAISPLVGLWIDRYGTGLLLAGSSLLTGVLAIGLALISAPWAFYSLYIPGRMIFTGSLELALPTAISTWFVRRRPLGLAVDAVAKGAGLAIIPLAAQLIIGEWGWRTAWTSLGILSLAVGIFPSLVLMARRPEDMGLEVDPVPRTTPREEPVEETAGDLPDIATDASGEANFTVGQALRTRAFWLLATFTAAGFMVQGGVSLHQVAHYINQGIPGPLAALSTGAYAAAQIAGGLFWGFVGRRVPLRFLLSLAALLVGIAVLSTIVSFTPPAMLASAALVGFGVGGLHLLVRLAWADYYGRQHLGAIRGLTLSAQIGGQALGPVMAGFLFDATNSYRAPFLVFALAVWSGGLLVLAAVPPQMPAAALPADTNP
ncbi:MAG: MFS transporter [Chloroflexi bacterium]|nr:MFS transporter [Chloroflexota bacterium]